jgi:signal transduction histidine kinase
MDGDKVGGAGCSDRQATAVAYVADHADAIPYQRVREACHDLRQPIATINALASAALGESRLSPEIAGWLELIIAEARYLDSIVLDALGRSGIGVPFDVAALVAEIVQHRELTAGCALETDLTSVVVRGADVDICRVVDNLIGNAERATEGRGRVLVTVAPHAEDCLVSVEDDGPGFGARVPSGWSLGLQVVHRLTANLGGRVDVGRSSLGGARVSLILPALATQDRAS